MRMMVATWWMICSLKSCARGRGSRGLRQPGPSPQRPTTPLISEIPSVAPDPPSPLVPDPHHAGEENPAQTSPRLPPLPLRAPPPQPTLRLTSEAMLKSRDQ